MVATREDRKPFDSFEKLVQAALRREDRALARAITLIEEYPDRAEELFALLPERRGNRAHVLGVTGSPGAGKSTLVNQLAAMLHSARTKVAVLAVDPSSPFSGGALLGDRVRMELAERHRGLFIRSLASRGASGGLSLAVSGVCEFLRRVGFNWIIVETVGVGQAEVDIVRLADTCLVVLVPSMGDSVQALKAGILEIADIFVINKSDLPGADTTVKDLRLMLSLARDDAAGFTSPIVQCTATAGTGVAELVAQIRSFDKHSPASGIRKMKLWESRLRDYVGELLWSELRRQATSEVKEVLTAISTGRVDLYSAGRRLLRIIRNER